MLPTVFITGFGPFRTHKQNSSWLAVQELLKMDIQDFHIVAEEVPVEYNHVLEVIPIMWEKIKPQLTVHCGMSDDPKRMILEKCAYNHDYKYPDIHGKVPAGNVCCPDGAKRLDTDIDVAAVAQDLNGAGPQIPVVVSESAGRYLCEFIYYRSLYINRNTVFIHVPPVSSDTMPEKMAEMLVASIRSMLKQCENSS